MKARAICAVFLAAGLMLFAGCETTYTDTDSAYSTREQRDAGTPGERDVGPAPDRAGYTWGGW